MVRQELQLLDEIIPETTLADVQLSEMPGLQNTGRGGVKFLVCFSGERITRRIEQWKRIAARTVHASPPLSRQYYQTLGPATDLQNGQLTQSLGSYRQPGRGSVHVDPPPAHRSPWRTLHRRIFVGSSIAVVVAAIVVAVVLAVTLSTSMVDQRRRHFSSLGRRTDQSATDYYRGSVHVRAQYDSSLSEPTSTLFRNYKREFCSLVSPHCLSSSVHWRESSGRKRCASRVPIEQQWSELISCFHSITEVSRWSTWQGFVCSTSPTREREGRKMSLEILIPLISLSQLFSALYRSTTLPECIIYAWLQSSNRSVLLLCSE